MSRSHQLSGFLPKIKKGSHTAAYKIFHYPFVCRIPAIHLVSEEVVSQAGSLTTGDPVSDRALAMQMVDAQLTIAGMAMHLHEGASIVIPSGEDAAKIYRIIKQHLDDWFANSQQNMHATQTNAEDLEKLDQLAGEIYPHARYHLIEKPFHGQLVNRLQELFARRGGLGRTGREQQAIIKRERKDTQPAQHTPMSEMINEQFERRKREWQ